MISRATELLHHLHNGMISPTALIIFIFVVIVFINSWMVQTVFTNRYGESSWTNILFSFVDMAIILYMSNTFSATIDYNLQSFFIAASLLSVTLALQYALVYIKTDNQDDKDIARIFPLSSASGLCHCSPQDSSPCRLGRQLLQQGYCLAG